MRLVALNMGGKEYLSALGVLLLCPNCNEKIEVNSTHDQMRCSNQACKEHRWVQTLAVIS